MKTSTKNQLLGKMHEVKGSAKKELGNLTNSPSLKVEGQIEKTSGKLRQKLSRVQSAVGK